jgi:hypothetical protein
VTGSGATTDESNPDRVAATRSLITVSSTVPSVNGSIWTVLIMHVYARFAAIHRAPSSPPETPRRVGADIRIADAPKRD